jgi:hypothetical protein
MVERIHFAESKYSSYQRRDQWLGGNSRYCESEKDIGTTITVGMIKSSMMTKATT